MAGTRVLPFLKTGAGQFRVRPYRAP